MDANWDNYRKQVLPLFPLLRVNDSQTQLIVDGPQPAFLTGKFRITQLKNPDSFLSGCYSMDNYSNFGKTEHPTIWVKPITKDGLDIKTPIQILRLKQKIKDKSKAFYDASESLKYDKLALKKYEKEYADYLKQLDKSRKAKEKEAKDAAKHLEKMRKEELKAQRDALQQQQQGQDQQQLTQDQLAQQQLAQQQLAQQQLAQQAEQVTDLSQDKLYTKDDVSKANDELDKLKMEMKRRETVLKNIASNIKLLKSQRHGEDSEQRQLQQREYEQKERELILFRKLVEQREEKLKVLKILTDKLSAKDEMERSEMMRRDEINKQQNFLALQNEMNSITEKQSREMGDSLSSVQNDEISSLQSKLNSLEGDETDIQREIVQNGGGRNRKDDLRGLLYKTESRKNRTKKKGRNGRKNERKKDRSLRKRA